LGPPDVEEETDPLADAEEEPGPCVRGRPAEEEQDIGW
jgi:hypothetical protein